MHSVCGNTSVHDFQQSMSGNPLQLSGQPLGTAGEGLLLAPPPPTPATITRTVGGDWGKGRLPALELPAAGGPSGPLLFNPVAGA